MNSERLHDQGEKGIMGGVLFFFLSFRLIYYYYFPFFPFFLYLESYLHGILKHNTAR